MKRVIHWLLATILVTVIAGCSAVTQQAEGKGDIRILSLDNSDVKLPYKIEKQFAKDGFYISANSEMNVPFMKQFQQTDFKVFHLLTIFHKELSEKLINKMPNAGIFVPMGVGIYQAKEDKQLHVSILTAQAQSKILGLKTVEPILVEIEKRILASLKKSVPNASVVLDVDNPLPAKGPLVSSYTLEVEDDEWEDTKEELSMTIEDGFKPMGFVMSNFTDYNYMLTKEETVESAFDFYDTYSICKLKVIYNVAKTRPQAAAFAPCTMMLYKKKDSQNIVMGFPGVYNWMSSARVIDENAIKELMKAQTDFEDILRGATE